MFALLYCTCVIQLTTFTCSCLDKIDFSFKLILFSFSYRKEQGWHLLLIVEFPKPKTFRYHYLSHHQFEVFESAFEITTLTKKDAVW